MLMSPLMSFSTVAIEISDYVHTIISILTVYTHPFLITTDYFFMTGNVPG